MRRLLIAKLPDVPWDRREQPTVNTSLPRLQKRRRRAKMQALETHRMEYLRVQLKVCEGCGGLWFRTHAEEKYGRCCAGKLAQHAMAHPEQRRARRRHTVAVTTGGAA